MVRDLMKESLPTTDAYLSIIKGCLNNSRLAQKQMYEKLAPRMFSLCMRYVGNKEQAKDILHDGFITLFQKLEKYNGSGSFEGWARRIFVTTALMYLRKNDVLKFSVELDDSPVIYSDGENALQKLEAQSLLKLIMCMPPGFRTVFNMFVIEGYTHQEIAKALNITEGGSRSQLSRARIWLQDKLRMEEIYDR